MPILRVTNTQKHMYTRIHKHTHTHRRTAHTRALGSKTIFNLNWATAVLCLLPLKNATRRKAISSENCVGIDVAVVVDVIIVVNVALLLSKPNASVVNRLCGYPAN